MNNQGFLSFHIVFPLILELMPSCRKSSLVMASRMYLLRLLFFLSFFWVYSNYTYFCCCFCCFHNTIDLECSYLEQSPLDACLVPSLEVFCSLLHNNGALWFYGSFPEARIQIVSSDTANKVLLGGFYVPQNKQNFHSGLFDGFLCF